jgi:hypothetical protein
MDTSLCDSAQAPYAASPDFHGFSAVEIYLDKLRPMPLLAQLRAIKRQQFNLDAFEEAVADAQRYLSRVLDASRRTDLAGISAEMWPARETFISAVALEVQMPESAR